VNHARLEVISGPMFSGKSEELIRRLSRAEIAGKRVVAFKPSIDNRYNIWKISSHSGGTFNAEVLANTEQRILASWFDRDVLAFDEAQFFDEEFILDACQTAMNYGKLVIVAGLDKTYRGEPFGVMPTLLALADDVLKLTAVCHRCGADATFTQRLINGEPAPFSGDTIQVGGLDSYEARCRACYERA
jgi:thymidine kinase